MPGLAATLVAALLVYGCGDPGTQPPQNPLNPTPAVSALVPAPPSVPVLGPPPVLIWMSKDVGSTAGGLLIDIDGAGFSSNATMTIGGAVAHAGPNGPNYFLAVVPPGAAGQVDVVITNSDGQSFTRKNGFTYLPPASFDMNGEWWGITGWMHELEMSFTIRNNMLVSASCGGSPNLVATPVPVTNGSFSVGNSFSGRVLGYVTAVGTISGDSPCESDNWRGYKK